MRNIDFATHYEALGLEPGASDKEITQAKRAFNELYHSDRLGHMSSAAQSIGADKVRAANEAARVLLDPSLRSVRDQWVVQWRARDSPHPPLEDQPSPAAQASRPSADVPVSQERGFSPLARALLASIAIGALVGASAFLLQGDRSASDAQTSTRPNPDTILSVLVPEPAVRSNPKFRPVVDSMITIGGDGGWTARINTGGTAWQASFIPESDNVMYRVRTNGAHEYVLNSEPGFRRITEAVQSYEFASLTGQPVRVRFTRWPRNAPRGTVVHTKTLALSSTGEWSQRVWLGPLGFRWDVDRAVAYEVRDDEGRISRVPPSVQSVAFGRTPVWIRFRSIDSLPLSLTFSYTAP